MNKVIKALLVTTSAIAISASSSMAIENIKKPGKAESELKVKLSAYNDFQAGFRKQSKLAEDEKNVSANKKYFALYNSAAFSADVSNEFDGVIYGGRLALVPTAKRKGGPVFNGTHLYVETEYGRVEAGSPFSAASTMMIDGNSIATGAVTNWSRYADLSVAHFRKDGSKANPSFATLSEFFIGDKLATKLDDKKFSSEPPRSIVYYTPNFEMTESTKVQVGVSYTPDTSNTGADSQDKDSSGVSTIAIDSDGVDRFEFINTVKDALSAGATIEQNITDGVDLKIAATGEYGKSTGVAKKYVSDADDNPSVYKLSNLRTYNIGAVLNYGNFSYAASYGNLGKSLTTKEYHKTGRDTHYYTGTVAYKLGSFGTSISYFKSNQFKNIVDAVSIATDYKLAPGFKPYAQVSVYSLKGKSEFFKDADRKKLRGTVALIGAKLNI